MTSGENKFGAWLRVWRKNKGLTQVALGKIVNVSPQHISNLERGEQHTESGAVATPSHELTVKLAKALGRPLREALEAAGYQVPPNGTSEIVAPQEFELSQYIQKIIDVINEVPRSYRPKLLNALLIIYNEPIPTDATEITQTQPVQPRHLVEELHKPSEDLEEPNQASGS